MELPRKCAMRGTCEMRERECVVNGCTSEINRTLCSLSSLRVCVSVCECVSEC